MKHLTSETCMAGAMRLKLFWTCGTCVGQDLHPSYERNDYLPPGFWLLLHLSRLSCQDVLVLVHTVLPRHFGLLILGGGHGGLGDLAGYGPQCGQRRSTIFFWNTGGFGGQGWGGLVEVVEQRLREEGVRVEVLVKVAVGLDVWRSIHLQHCLWCSSPGQTHKLGLRVSEGLGWGRSSWGRVAPAGQWFDSIQDLRLRYTGPERLVGRVQVLLVGGPGLAAGDGLQRVRHA